ncbi:hypothetical protein, partial [Pseudomonas fluorescens]|uniref:hypothetical protein n=1 Tax=Pseudomonas fluorescens TaxID=294 RepID=UPI00177C3942
VGLAAALGDLAAAQGVLADLAVVENCSVLRLIRTKNDPFADMTSVQVWRRDFFARQVCPRVDTSINETKI